MRGIQKIRSFRRFLSGALLAVCLTACGSERPAAVSEDEHPPVSDYYDFRELPDPVFFPAGDSFAEGDGSEENPYVIRTREELVYFAELINSDRTNREYRALYFELGADIVLNEGDAGGIIGFVRANKGDFTLNRCANEGEITSEKGRSGGIIGEYFSYGNVSIHTEIVDCVNRGNVRSGGAAGGIVACMEGVRGSSESESTVELENCVNEGILTVDEAGVSDVCLGGMIGIYGVQGIPALLSGCSGSGELRVEPRPEREPDGSEHKITIATICGGVIGRVGGALYLTMDSDGGESAYVDGADAVVRIRDCESIGRFQIPESVTKVVTVDEVTHILQCGGILGNAAGEADYSVKVEDSRYSGTERGLGDQRYPDVDVGVQISGS